MTIDRLGFLKRGALFVGALVIGPELLKQVPPATAETVEPVTPFFGGVYSSGLCAPVSPYYRLVHIDHFERPVRDALPHFEVAQGGITYKRPAGLDPE